MKNKKKKKKAGKLVLLRIFCFLFSSVVGNQIAVALIRAENPTLSSGS